MLGLGRDFGALLFDMDGVLTQTADVHCSVWSVVLSEVLETISVESGEPQKIFDQEDFEQYINGRTREDGIAAFLASRRIFLPRGDPADPPTALTVCGIAGRKSTYTQTCFAVKGVEAFPDSRVYLEAAKQEGVRMAVVSSSSNVDRVLSLSGLARFFTVRVDGNVARRFALNGKPAPDTFLFAASALAVSPRCAAVFEDAVSGVSAAREGGFGLVVGVDRSGRHAEALRLSGADLVVSELTCLLRRQGTIPGGL